MLTVTLTDAFKKMHPGALIGILEIGEVDNSSPSNALNEEKRATEARLRQRYAGYTRAQFLALPVIAAYESYYKRFEKTYHVQLQLESIVLKNKNLPDVSPLVDANFAAEVETLVLTAGHDVAKLKEPLCIDVTQPDENFVQMNGSAKKIRGGDMAMRDGGGISCTVIYGQDNRSPIAAATRNVLYVAYAPSGVGEAVVTTQLDAIERNIQKFAPKAQIEQKLILTS